MRRAIACPRCGATVAPGQDWCLECGAAARTRLAPTPNWHAPVAVIAVVVLLAGAGLAAAFVALTNDSTKAPANTGQTAPAVATEPTAAPPPTTPPTTATAPAPAPTTATFAAPTTSTPAPPTATSGQK